MEPVSKSTLAVNGGFSNMTTALFECRILGFTNNEEK